MPDGGENKDKETAVLFEQLEHLRERFDEEHGQLFGEGGRGGIIREFEQRIRQLEQTKADRIARDKERERMQGDKDKSRDFWIKIIGTVIMISNLLIAYTVMKGKL